MYDLIVIGAGPAGLTAAVYASRYKLSVLVFGKLHGGLIAEAHEVCNFPTYEKIKGFELAMKMTQQVKKFGVEIKSEEIKAIEKNGNSFIVKGNKEYQAKKVIIATGTERRQLNVKGEKEFLSKGVSYCATCDSSFYKDKIAGVVGGSDAALTAALLLAEYAKKVYIIYRKEKFSRAEPSWIELVEKNEKIEKLFNANVTEIYGKNKVEGVKLDNGKDIILDGIFIEIGSSPDEKLPKCLGLSLENGFVRVNKKQETNVKGVFAAGDITNNPLKQVVTACAEGAIAAFSAYEEIKTDETKD
jgi:thioredoxin reductase (NADPH)